MSKIYFKDSKGRNICGQLSNPESINNTLNKKRAIILCHGLGGKKDSSFYLRLQKKLNKFGFTTLSIDLLGHGESDGEYNDILLTETMDDICCAKKYLFKQGYKKISFIGHSFGAVGGIMVASELKFEFLVLISPPTYFDIHEMLSTGIRVIREINKFNSKKIDTKKDSSLTVKFFKDYGSHDSYKAASNIASPVLIIQGDKDTIIPLKKTIELHKHIKSSYLKLLPNIDHHYRSHEAETQVINAVMEFVEQQI